MTCSQCGNSLPENTICRPCSTIRLDREDRIRKAQQEAHAVQVRAFIIQTMAKLSTLN